MFRRSIGTFERLSRARSRPPTTILPLVGSSSFSSSRTSVDLPEPDAPTTKTNSPLSMWNVTSLQRDDVGLVDLRHRLEDDHRAGARARVVSSGAVDESGRRGVGCEIWFLHGGFRGRAATEAPGAKVWKV